MDSVQDSHRSPNTKRRLDEIQQGIRYSEHWEHVDMIYWYAPISATRFPNGNQALENPHDRRHEQQFKPTIMPEELKLNLRGK